MRTLRRLLSRLVAPLLRHGHERRLRKEFAEHLELLTEDLIRSGLPPSEARRQAALKFGPLEATKEAYRDQRGFPLFETLAADVRFGWRLLRRSPVFTSVAIVSLALGVGANVVAFSVINALILRPLPFPNPNLLVTVQTGTGPTLSFPNYRDLRDRNDVFSGTASYRITVLGLDTGESPERVWGYLATGNYFEVLDVSLLLGRFFGPAEDRERGGSPYAVLSYSCWQRRFAGDPDIVGKEIRLNGLPYTVLGVADQHFQGTELFYFPEIWVPMSMQAQVESFSWLDNRSAINAIAVGRLKDGISREEASARLQALAAVLAKEYPSSNDGLSFSLAQPGLAGDMGRAPVKAFTVGVLLLAGLVLLAACVNLASLLAARTTDRHKELAVRTSLGAGRGRIARQLLVESLLLASGGGLAAWGQAAILPRLLSRWRAPLEFPVQFNVEPDWRVLLFTCFISAVSGLLIGLVPARHAWNADPNAALKGMPAGSPKKWTLPDLLLPIQAALCCLLIMTSLTSLRGLQRAWEIPLGFEPNAVAVVGFDLGLAQFQRPQGQAVQREMLDTIANSPGVIAAAFANSAPLSMDHSFNAVAPEEG